MKRGSWAILHSENIQDMDGSSYIKRLRLLATPWFSCYLHRILAPDPQRPLHDHPWVFWSLIVRGGYIEDIAVAIPGQPFNDHRAVRVRLFGSFKKFPKTLVHRISYVMPNTTTLVFTGRRTVGEDSWGFWVRDATQHINWRDYLRDIGHPQAEDL
jgi:hypothetical protein